MVLYQVKLQVEPEIQSPFLSWLEGHIEEMLEFDGFLSAQILNSSAFSSEKCTFWVHYMVDSMDSLENYFHNHAERMRQQSQKLFLGQVTAERQVLSVKQSFTCSSSRTSY